MAKIVYGVSGEGSGHSSRSREVIRHLESRGHEVVVVTYDRGVRNLKDDFRVVEIVGLHLVSENNRISKSRTLSENLELLPEAIEARNRVKQEVFETFKPDAVFTDFEPLTAYLANHYRLPLVTIDNQHRMRYLEFDYPKGMRTEAKFIENVVRAIVPKPSVSLITCFYDGPLKHRRCFLFAPILRSEVLRARPSAGGHVLVYATQAFDALPALLSGFENERFKVYGFPKTGVEGNIEYFAPSSEGFLAHLAAAKGVIATAGFTLMTEAFHLGKPMLALPLKGQFEQELNAYMLDRLEYGQQSENCNRRDIASFLYDIPRYARTLQDYPRNGNEAIFKRIDRLLAKDMKLLKAYHARRTL